MSKDEAVINLFETADVCTHSLPNKLQVISEDFKFQFAKTELWSATLADTGQVLAYKCQSETKCEQGKTPISLGKWTTVYDQALKIELESGERFLSNFRYNIRNSVSHDPLTDSMLQFTNLATTGVEDFDSDCTKTMIGFVQQIPGSSKEKRSTMAEHKAVCFYGTRAAKTAETPTKKPSSLADELVQISAEDTSNERTKAQPKPTGRGQGRRRNLHFDHKPSAKMDVLIHTINNSDIGWKADACKLSNPPKNCHENKINKLAQVSNADETHAFGEGAEFDKVKEKVQKYQNRYKSANEIPDTELPA